MNEMTAGRKLVRLPVPKLRVPSAGPQSEAEQSGPSQSDVTAAIEAMNRAFETFKAENDQRLSALSKGKGDTLTDEKVDRINAEVGELDKSVRALSQQIAASAMLGGSAGSEPPESKQYRNAFKGWMRGKVNDNALSAALPQNAMSTSSDPDGGFLLPEPTEGAMTRVLGTISAIRGLAEVVSITSQTYKKPKNLAGASSGWVTEKGSRTETNTPQLSELAFPTFEQYAMPAATQGLLDDAATDVEGWLAQEVSIEFAEKEGAAFWNGDGVSKPRGIASYTNIANASYAWGKIGYTATGVAAAINDASNNGGDALISLVHSCKPGYRVNGSFLMNDLTSAAVRKLKDANGVYLWQPGLVAGAPSMLLGYPVALDDNVDDIGANKYPIGFGDFRRGYVVVDRLGTRVLRDPYTSKPYVLFYTTRRVGGGVQDFAAIKLLKCATS